MSHFKLLEEYQSLNEKLVLIDEFSNLYDSNLYDIEGYYTEELLNSESLEILIKRINGLKKLILAWQILEENETVFC